MSKYLFISLFFIKHNYSHFILASFHCTCANSTCTFCAHYAIADLLSYLIISKYIDAATASNGEKKCLAYFQDLDSENGEKINRKWKWKD